MATIVTNANWLQVDGARLQKGKWDLSLTKAGVRLSDAGERIDIPYEGTTIDGATVTGADELFAFFEAQGFKDGGGDGQGVTWDDVQDKPLKTLDTPIADAEGLVPVYTQEGQLPVGMPEFPENAVPLALLDARAPALPEGDFLIGGASGNEGRKILPIDLGSANANDMFFNFNNSGFGVLRFDVNPSVNALVRRTNTGQGKFTPAINGDEAVVLSQFQGIINDELTDTETSITLNGLYPSIAVGSVVVSEVALTEYRKIEPTVWSKKTIEII